MNNGLVLKEVHKKIKFNQKFLAKTIYWYEYWSKKKNKKWFEKDSFKLIKNAVFEKTIENVRKHIKLVTTEKRRNYLVSKPNYHSTKFLTEHVLAIQMKKT